MTSLATLKITADDIRATDWRGAIAEAGEQDCSAYCAVFYERASKEGCAEPAKSVYFVLGALTSFHFRPDDEIAPFGPMGVMGGRRTAIVDDFTEDQLKALREVLEEIDDPELQARIADVLWLRMRDYRAAVIAVESYLEVARAVEDHANWLACADRLIRAFRLAVTLGRRGTSFEHALRRVEEVLARCNGEDPLYLSAKLMEVLLDHDDGDATVYGPLAEKLASAAGSAGDVHRSETYSNLAARWWHRANDEPRARASTEQAAEGFLRAAEEAAARGEHFVAVIHLQKGIAILRKAPGTKTRVEELHRTLLDYQAESLSEFKPLSVRMDIGELVAEAVAQRSRERTCARRSSTS